MIHSITYKLKNIKIP